MPFGRCQSQAINNVESALKSFPHTSPLSRAPCAEGRMRVQPSAAYTCKIPAIDKLLDSINHNWWWFVSYLSCPHIRYSYFPYCVVAPNIGWPQMEYTEKKEVIFGICQHSDASSPWHNTRTMLGGLAESYICLTWISNGIRVQREVNVDTTHQMARALWHWRHIFVFRLLPFWRVSVLGVFQMWKFKNHYGHFIAFGFCLMVFCSLLYFCLLLLLQLFSVWVGWSSAIEIQYTAHPLRILMLRGRRVRWCGDRWWQSV